ncbi:Vacuolar protein sorting-associated protein [Nesidiocoris tenuis]|uniref:Vacuolar protein sorting-associated protein n=1 Tax=Nesidiocoris tenuis TaxID=355587 RepID=A0ABN7ANX7_9HEMI|nr:Vacuolar protein sorting-associated protein [Nesidiocoris tenuis]
MALQLPPVPASLRSIQHYLKTAAEHEARDPVVAYWCRLYALQTALKIDKKSDEAKTLLVRLMDWLEMIKKEMSDNEAITNDIAAQAHVENYALTLFEWADKQDRAGVANKNVVKAFFTAGMLMDVLTTFSELDEHLAANNKYAKWKASYIHNCLKNGEIPVPGPVTDGSADDVSSPGVVPPPQDPGNMYLPVNPKQSSEEAEDTSPTGGSFTPFVPPPSASSIPSYSTGASTDGGGAPVKLDAAQIAKAQKYCKFAGSALNYDDVTEAISCLQKALRLLQTGEDS